MIDQTNKQYWKDIAKSYDIQVGETGHIRHEQITNPAVFDLLGDLSGKVVLDAGCGNGYLSRRMAKGAKKVVGIDLTEELIEIAKGRRNPANVEFYNGSLAELPFTDNFFDVILSNLVLMDVEKLDKVMTELYRVLKENGTIVISIIHPCFENPPRTYKLKNRDGKKIGLVVQSYFDTGLIVDQKGEEVKNVNYRHYHRTISDYLNVFSKNGFCLIKTIEPEFNSHINPLDDAPTFIIFKLKKP